MSTTKKPIFDNQFFNDITDGDDDFKKELIDIFISSTAEQLSEIEKVANSNNSDEDSWHSVLHSLKGSCFSIGALKLSDFIANSQNEDSKHSKEEKIEIYKEIAKLLEEIKSEMLKIKDE